MEPLTILLFSAPVAFAAIGETISQKAGVINIGLEGSMLMSAYFGAITGISTGNPWLGLGAGIVAGILVCVLSAVFTVRMGADQVVVGTAINLLALGLTNTFYSLRFGRQGSLLSIKSVPVLFDIPHVGRFDAVLAFLLISIPLATWLVQRTTWGLAVRSAGEYPKAAEAAGFSVRKLRFQAVALGGAFAGLAGAYLALGVAGSFAPNMTSGRGFVAIAMVTFGRWKPVYVVLAALLIGTAEALQYRVQSTGLHVPYQLLVAAPYVLALLVLVIVGKGTVAPQGLGIAYKKES